MSGHFPDGNSISKQIFFRAWRLQTGPGVSSYVRRSLITHQPESIRGSELKLIDRRVSLQCHRKTRVSSSYTLFLWLLAEINCNTNTDLDSSYIPWVAYLSPLIQ